MSHSSGLSRSKAFVSSDSGRPSAAITGSSTVKTSFASGYLMPALGRGDSDIFKKPIDPSLQPPSLSPPQKAPLSKENFESITGVDSHFKIKRPFNVTENQAQPESKRVEHTLIDWTPLPAAFNPDPFLAPTPDPGYSTRISDSEGLAVPQKDYSQCSEHANDHSSHCQSSCPLSSLLHGSSPDQIPGTTKQHAGPSDSTPSNSCAAAFIDPYAEAATLEWPSTPLVLSPPPKNNTWSDTLEVQSVFGFPGIFLAKTDRPRPPSPSEIFCTRPSSDTLLEWVEDYAHRRGLSGWHSEFKTSGFSTSLIEDRVNLQSTIKSVFKAHVTEENLQEARDRYLDENRNNSKEIVNRRLDEKLLEMGLDVSGNLQETLEKQRMTDIVRLGPAEGDWVRKVSDYEDWVKKVVLLNRIRHPLKKQEISVRVYVMRDYHGHPNNSAPRYLDRQSWPEALKFLNQWGQRISKGKDVQGTGHWIWREIDAKGLLGGQEKWLIGDTDYRVMMDKMKRVKPMGTILCYQQSTQVLLHRDKETGELERNRERAGSNSQVTGADGMAKEEQDALKYLDKISDGLQSGELVLEDGRIITAAESKKRKKATNSPSSEPNPNLRRSVRQRKKSNPPSPELVTPTGMRLRHKPRTPATPSRRQPAVRKTANPKPVTPKRKCRKKAVTPDSETIDNGETYEDDELAETGKASQDKDKGKTSKPGLSISGPTITSTMKGYQAKTLISGIEVGSGAHTSTNSLQKGGKKKTPNHTEMALPKRTSAGTKRTPGSYPN